MNDQGFSNLSKKERKKLKREIERAEREKQGKKTSIVKLLIIASLLGLVGVGGWFAYKELSKPLPGQKMPDQGRNHVDRAEWETFSYNSNPPTSGSHDATWIKAGVYDSPQGDGYLVHSLEHGYVILHYDCNAEKLEVKSATLPLSLSDQECDALKKQLSDLANDKRLWKLIVVSRPTLDSRIAATAWTVIDKMDTFDKNRIVSFIDTYRNQGPEKTME